MPISVTIQTNHSWPNHCPPLGQGQYLPETATSPPPPQPQPQPPHMSSSSHPEVVIEIREKPKRPLSAYNLFFQEERKHILANRPVRPQGVPLRRGHGKMGFAEMAKTIAAKWNSIDAETKKKFESLALDEKIRYKKKMYEWKQLLNEANNNNNNNNNNKNNNNKERQGVDSNYNNNNNNNAFRLHNHNNNNSHNHNNNNDKEDPQDHLPLPIQEQPSQEQPSQEQPSQPVLPAIRSFNQVIYSPKGETSENHHHHHHHRPHPHRPIRHYNEHSSSLTPTTGDSPPHVSFMTIRSEEEEEENDVDDNDNEMSTPPPPPPLTHVPDLSSPIRQHSPPHRYHHCCINSTTTEVVDMDTSSSSRVSTSQNNDMVLENLTCHPTQDSYHDGHCHNFPSSSSSSSPNRGFSYNPQDLRNVNTMRLYREQEVQEVQQEQQQEQHEEQHEEQVQARHDHHHQQQDNVHNTSHWKTLSPKSTCATPVYWSDQYHPHPHHPHSSSYSYPNSSLTSLMMRRYASSFSSSSKRNHHYPPSDSTNHHGTSDNGGGEGDGSSSSSSSSATAPVVVDHYTPLDLDSPLATLTVDLDNLSNQIDHDSLDFLVDIFQRGTGGTGTGGGGGRHNHYNPTNNNNATAMAAAAAAAAAAACTP